MDHPPFLSKSHLLKTTNHEIPQKTPLSFQLNRVEVKQPQQTFTSFQRYMKFRKWLSEDFFIKIVQQILEVSVEQCEQHLKQLKGGVYVKPNWTILNWICEFQNALFWSRNDKNLTNTSEQKNKIPYKSLLQISPTDMNKLSKIWNKKQLEKQLNKCIKYIFQCLSKVILYQCQTEFYAVQFLLKLIKLNQFFINMKNFQLNCRKLESLFDDSGTINSKIYSYGDTFLQRKQPVLKNIKSEVQQLLQYYQIQQSMQEHNSKMYEIQICIKLVRNQIYSQHRQIHQKDQNFEFVVQKAGLSQILEKISNIRSKDETINCRNSIKVTQLIKKNNKIVNKVISQLGQPPKKPFEFKQNLEISHVQYQYNSENSNTFIEEQSKTIKNNQKVNQQLTFSKLYELRDLYKEVFEEGDIYSEPSAKSLLQMLEDQKTIKHNFTQICEQVKKQKKIKKIKKSSKIVGFNCINGKIIMDQNQKQSNHTLEIKDLFLHQRLKRLSARNQQHVSNQTQNKLSEQSSQNSNQTSKVNGQLELQIKSNYGKKSSQNEKILEQNQKSTKQSIYVTPIRKDKIYSFIKTPSAKCQDSNSFDQICNENHNKNTDNQPAHKQLEKNLNVLHQQIKQANRYLSSTEKTINIKQNYKLANNRFAPVSKKNSLVNDRFNSIISYKKRHKNPQKSSRGNLQPNPIPLSFYKKYRESTYDAKFFPSNNGNDEYLVDDTPPKYKKTKLINE